MNLKCSLNGSIDIDGAFSTNGFDPEIDEVVELSIEDIITNPEASLSDVGDFEVSTFDEIDGKY